MLLADENQDEAERRETVEDRICFLKQLGLSETKLAKLDLHSNDKRRFSVLETSVKKLNDVATFLTEEVGLSKEQAAKCLFMSMGSCSVDACLRPKVVLLSKKPQEHRFSGDSCLKLSWGWLCLYCRRMQSCGMLHCYLNFLFLSTA